MAGPSYFGRQYSGADAFDAPLDRLASKEEILVYYELARRIGVENFIVDYSPGDVPYTMGRENRSAEFLIPAMRTVILVNSTFTHPSLTADEATARNFHLLGFRVYFIWDYQILPERGGDVRKALDEIPGLKFFGQNRTIYAGWVHNRRYGQPRIDQSFEAVGQFKLLYRINSRV